MTSPTTGLHGQMVLTPLPFPIGQGTAGHAKAIGSVMVRQPAAAGPTVECHRAATGGAICFTPLALSGPASFQRFWGTGIHQFLGCCYGAVLPEPKSAIPALTILLTDKSDNVRWAAAKTLGKIGPEARSAVPALTELLRDKDRYLQCHQITQCETEVSLVASTS